MSKPRVPGRRQMRRVMKRIPAAFGSREVRSKGYVSKLSRKGLFFSAPTLPRPGDRVRVRFNDANGNKITVEGEVRWAIAQIDPSRSGFGMQIDKPPDEYLEFYEEMLTS